MRQDIPPAALAVAGQVSTSSLAIRINHQPPIDIDPLDIQDILSRKTCLKGKNHEEDTWSFVSVYYANAFGGTRVR